jgi:hypothetical protein
LNFDTETQKYQLQDIFERRYNGVDKSGGVISELVPTGVLPSFMHQLEEHGVTLPDPVLQVAREHKARTGGVT